MKDEPASAMREAEGWLASAKHSLVEAQSDDVLASVCSAQAIHALIRANDALTMKLLGRKSTRHEDAPALFADLLREGKLPATEMRFRRLLARAMRDKSGADYGRKRFSPRDAEEYVSEAEMFIAMARTYI